MKTRFDAELAAGLFVILGVVCLGYLSIRLGEVELPGRRGYEVFATFSDVGGLKGDASVVIAGVSVGYVKNIDLVGREAHVILYLKGGVDLRADAVASIKTRGLIGEKYVEITPGEAGEALKPGGRIRATQAAMDLESMLSKSVFGAKEVVVAEGYQVLAIFSNAGGLKTGAPVAIAGVDVGRVKSIDLDSYQARVVLCLPRSVKLQADAIASIKTRGLVGEKYVEISPGGSDEIILPGGRIRETEPAVDLEALIAKYIFGGKPR